MVVGGYELHLYCDGKPCVKLAWDGPAARTGHPMAETYREAAAPARKAGWWIAKDRSSCLCPACAEVSKHNSK